MIARRNGRTFECVVVDLDTQRDFCDPQGAYPVANLPGLIPAIRRVIAWTKRNHAPVVSSLESHRLWELPSDGRSLLFCIDGTAGQRKLACTVFASRARVEMDNTLAVPIDLFGQYQQVIFRKRTDDLLANPKADRFLTQLPAQEFVVFGNGLESSVKALTLGLLAREKRVTIVFDACGYWDRSTAELALRQVSAKGAAVVSVSELLARKLDRRYRYPITIHDAEGNGGYANGRFRCNGSAIYGRPIPKPPGPNGTPQNGSDVDGNGS